jgi:hypothetical protein
MSELMDDIHRPTSPETGEVPQESVEQTTDDVFRLISYDPSNFPEDKLPIIRAWTASQIKESLENYSRLDGNARAFREVSTRGDYIWAIITELGMTNNEYPTPEYREAFTRTHEHAKDLKSAEIGELMDKYEDHPSLTFLDTLTQISPGTTEVKTELVMLRRSLLVLLDEYA